MPGVPAKTCTAAALTLVCCLALAETVSSRIDSVIVYPRGATVTRIAEATLDGSQTVVLHDLMANLDPTRLQVGVTGNAELRGVTMRTSQQELPVDAEVRRLEADIEDVRDKLSASADATRTARLKLRFLEGIAAGYAKESWFEGARGNADVTSWQAALDLLELQSARAYDSVRSNAIEDRQTNRSLSKLQRELASLTSRSKATGELALEMAGSGQTAITVSYFVPQASWTSNYEARVDSDTARIELIHRGRVRQATDENWSDVRLSFSTAQPDAQTEVALPEPEFVRIRPPQTMARRFRIESEAVAASADGLEEVVVTGSYIKRSNTSYGATYATQGRTSIANNLSEGRQVDLERHAFDSILRSRIVPMESTRAFLVAEITNNTDQSLHPAPLNIYVDGTFSGQAMMPQLLAGQTVDLPLGQDRAVEVRVTDKGGETDTSGLLGRRINEPTYQLFTIHSRHARAIEAEVFDQYPVSRHEDVEVRVARSATTPDVTNYKDQPGVVVWRKRLAAGERRDIRHEYTLSYPADQQIEAF